MIGSRSSGTRFVDFSLRKPRQVSSTPVVVENSVDLGDQDIRVAYYKKRGIGQTVPVPGALGMGSGISHTIYRVPKSQLLTRNEVSKIYKNESNAILAAQSAERAAAAVVRQGEMNANVAGIVYTDEPMTKIDIDMPINLGSLAEKVRELAKQQKKNHVKLTTKRYMEGKTPIPNPTVDEIVAAAKTAFIKTEVEKATRTSPSWNTRGRIVLYGKRDQERHDNHIKEHIDRKMPKIEAVLAKLREGMILGFAPPAPKVVPKEENLLRFNNLAGINFSAPAGSAAAGTGAPSYRDPFEGLNSSPNTPHRAWALVREPLRLMRTAAPHANFVAAGIEIEPETVERLSKNQRSTLLTKLKAMNKSQHNSEINSFLNNALRKGGKRTTRKARKVKKTRKVKHS
jgi:hypothetical protein